MANSKAPARGNFGNSDDKLARWTPAARSVGATAVPNGTRAPLPPVLPHQHPSSTSSLPISILLFCIHLPLLCCFHFSGSKSIYFSITCCCFNSFSGFPGHRYCCNCFRSLDSYFLAAGDLITLVRISLFPEFVVVSLISSLLVSCDTFRKPREAFAVVAVVVAGFVVVRLIGSWWKARSGRPGTVSLSHRSIMCFAVRRTLRALFHFWASSTWGHHIEFGEIQIFEFDTLAACRTTSSVASTWLLVYSAYCWIPRVDWAWISTQ